MLKEKENALPKCIEHEQYRAGWPRMNKKEQRKKEKCANEAYWSLVVQRMYILADWPYMVQCRAVEPGYKRKGRFRGLLSQNYESVMGMQGRGGHRPGGGSWGKVVGHFFAHCRGELVVGPFGEPLACPLGEVCTPELPLLLGGGVRCPGLAG